jgi:hypothetical protein
MDFSGLDLPDFLRNRGARKSVNSNEPVSLGGSKAPRNQKSRDWTAVTERLPCLLPKRYDTVKLRVRQQ